MIIPLKDAIQRLLKNGKQMPSSPQNG